MSLYRVSYFASAAIFSLLSVFPHVHSLGTSCSAPLGAGNATPTDPYWLIDFPQRGTSAFNANPSSYVVRRNVKDFGAKGDGVTDDTAAINAAISSGSRCGDATCLSSTLTPALVVFPAGKYLVSSPIISWYYTQLVGDAQNPPTLLASESFNGIAIIDADPYIAGGAQWYANQNNFYREVRNFIIDMTLVPATSSAAGLHWQVAQGTSLYNVQVNMSTAPETQHQGIFMENGSGGLMGDLIFNGGKTALWTSNQQFTFRNVTVNQAQTAFFLDWNWGMTFQGININNCQVGFQMVTGGTDLQDQTAGSEVIIDATVTNTPVFIQTSQPSNGKLAGSIVLDNIQLSNVSVAVGIADGDVVFAGPGSGVINHWAQGNVYSATNQTGQFVQGTINSTNKPDSLLVGGKVVSRPRPQYSNFSPSQIISVKAQGAKGDGSTDDTQTIQNVLDQFGGCNIIFFDAGTYIVTDTITIQEGTVITGEVWPVIMGTGPKFQSQSDPRPVVQVGAPGSTGIVEITDVIFSTRGPTPGAILLEWNVKGSSPASAAIWDSHIRVGGATGTNLQVSQCPAQGENITNCMGSFMSLHLTPNSSAYIEGLWDWTADHDIDDSNNAQISLFSGRGMYSESQGPVWLIGTAEHHTLYQYNVANTKDHYFGLMQTETPYYQPSPAPPSPFSTNSSFNDPTYPADLKSAWALNVDNSQNILVYGAGFYSFFQNYSQNCLNDGFEDCQTQIVNVDSSSSASIYGLSTIGASSQLSVNGVGVINQTLNQNGFQQTVTAWTQVEANQPVISTGGNTTSTHPCGCSDGDF